MRDERTSRVLGLRIAVDALADNAQGIDVESGRSRRGSRSSRLQQAQLRISWRFFSPPEKPSLTLRSANCDSISGRPSPPSPL